MSEQDTDGKKATIDPVEMYKSIRLEILDQKKCQFQLVGVSITVTAAILAYASKTEVGPLVYVASVIMNVLSIIIVLNKATSIQRMVGYLQLMESKEGITWMWEYHLNLFRGGDEEKGEKEPIRKHTYVLTISGILMLLIVLSCLLFFFGPSRVLLEKSPAYADVAELYGYIGAFVLVLGIVALCVTWTQYRALTRGKYTSAAIRIRWCNALEIKDI